MQYARASLNEWLRWFRIEGDHTGLAVQAKQRGAVAPKGFTRRYGNTIAARIGIVARDGLDACVYKGVAAPVNKAPPPVTKKARPLPGEEYESARPLPPIENAVSEIPGTTTEPQNAPGAAPGTPANRTESMPAPERPQEPANGV